MRIATVLLFVAICGVWVHGRYTTDRFFLRRDYSFWECVTARDGVLFGVHLHDTPNVPGEPGFTHESAAPERAGVELLAMFTLNVDAGDTFDHGRRAGFEWLRYRPRNGSYSFTYLIVPHWALLILAAGPLAIVLPGVIRAARGRRRDRAGLCIACGYDLRGSTSGTCPECGTARAAAPV